MKNLIWILGLTLLLLTACQTAPTRMPTSIPETPPAVVVPEPTPTAMPETPFRVIGYVTAAVIPELIPYDQITHINYAFLIPNGDGTFVPIANAWKLDKIVALAHPKGVKVLISVGGWGWDTEFETLAADEESRARFIETLAGFVADHDLDGIDMDWEYPDPGESAQHFVALMTGLRATLPEGKLLTAAVISSGDAVGLGTPNEVFPVMDFLNIMAYDGNDHGSMAQAQNALDYWLGRGLPAEKAVLGLPFYEHPNFTSYRKLVEFDPQAAYTDTIKYYSSEVRYNGIPTIQAKTQMAQERASGVMFWTLEQDAPGELSLINAIDAVRKGE